MKMPASALLLAVALACHAQADGGGEDVSVSLFSAQPSRALTVAAAGEGAWWASCAACSRQPLTTVLRMPETREIFAGGPLTVRDQESAQARTANGGWHLRRNARGYVDVVLTLQSERYVAAVLMAETAVSEPRESLRAMAVVARTRALQPLGKQHAPGPFSGDLCDSTACQAMKLGPVSDAVDEAVRSTAGETLWSGLRRAQTFFSQSCGGVTESAESLWPKLTGATYLRSVADPYCVRKDRAAWHAEVPLSALEEVAEREGWTLPRQIAAVQVLDRTPSQRARTIVFRGVDGLAAHVSASSLRFAIGHALGWGVVRSDWYDLRVRDGVLAFDGRGHGHGVGLCQQGATEMARMGKSYREILAFYFHGTSVRITTADEGWHEASSQGVTLRSAAEIKPESVQNVLAGWAEARSRFSPRQKSDPIIIFAPTTDIFRQLTSQPGWQLASTSGGTVVLQPANVFARNHVAIQSTLLHELLHVEVEAEANRKSPLWLREGLVEVLTGEASHTTPALSPETTNRLLRQAANRQQSLSAHQAASSRTQLLVERYGLSTVRGWLVSGTNPPVLGSEPRPPTSPAAGTRQQVH